MNKNLKMILFGIFTWLVPFVVSFFFYTSQGQLRIDIFLFKTIMIIVGAIVAAELLIIYFKTIKKDFVKEGLRVGLVWLVINWILDIAILLPMSGMGFEEYFSAIGLRYLVIPIFSTAIGYVAENK